MTRDVRFGLSGLIFVLLADCAVAVADGCPKLKLLHEYSHNAFHTLFARSAECSQPWVFSNVLEKNGVAYPVRINVANGDTVRTPVSDRLAVTEGETPDGLNKHPITFVQGVDSVPAPDCSRIYTHVFDGKRTPSLRMTPVDKSGVYAKSGDVRGSGWNAYDYPSPIQRDGKNLVLYRTERGLYAKEIKTSADGVSADGAKQICETVVGLPSGVIDGVASLPFSSGDGGLIGAEINGRMRILRVQWDREAKGKVPCELVSTLPATAGKVSFSPDNTRVVFHADSMAPLGKSLTGGTSYNSYLMNVASSNVVQLTTLNGDQSSEFPSFMGNDRIVTRVSSWNDNKTTFQVVSAPSSSAIDGCFGSSSQGMSPATIIH